ncbi:REDY-like protein HapK [Thermaurantiacus sp.]
MRILVLFNLKPSVPPADYEAWARAVDLPGVRAMRSVSAFHVYRVPGLLGSDASPPFRYAEVIDVADMELFLAEVSGEGPQRVAAEFRAMVEGEPLFLMTEAL